MKKMIVLMSGFVAITGAANIMSMQYAEPVVNPRFTDIEEARREVINGLTTLRESIKNARELEDGELLHACVVQADELASQANVVSIKAVRELRKLADKAQGYIEDLQDPEARREVRREISVEEQIQNYYAEAQGAFRSIGSNANIPEDQKTQMLGDIVTDVRGVISSLNTQSVREGRPINTCRLGRLASAIERSIN